MSHYLPSPSLPSCHTLNTAIDCHQGWRTLKEEEKLSSLLVWLLVWLRCLLVVGLRHEFLAKWAIGQLPT
jgi:hypothetical protein